MIQEEIEGAMVKAARDRVENLMKVVEKMQTQQTAMSVTLQGEKRKIATVSWRMAIPIQSSTPNGPTLIVD